jgi:hypothetical protein
MNSLCKNKVLMLLFAGLAIACNGDDATDGPADGDGGKALHVSTENVVTKAAAAVTTARYEVGEAIGISAKGATTPSDYDYTNVKYRLDSLGGTTGTAQYWNTTTEIVLKRQNATVTAYYPYREGTTPEALAIDCSDGIDWMFCPWTTQTLNARWPDVTLAMNHAQALLRVELHREGYAGEGKLKFIKIESNALALEGVFNTTDGTYTTANIGTLLQEYPEGEELQLPADPSQVCTDQWFFLPTTFTGSIDISFTVKVDRRTLSTTTTVDAGTMTRGRIHLYALKVMNSELEVSPVTIIPWVTVEDAHHMKPTN